MNSFGHSFRIQVFGESHGPYVGVTLDGVPAGIALNIQDFYFDLERRKAGAAGTTPRKEDDEPLIISGWFNGYTTGAPLTILFQNKNIQSKDYTDFLKVPRPGHADFTAHKKFKGFEDYRGSGHFSGRLTVLLVAAGVVAKKINPKFSISANLIEAGGSSNINDAIQNAIQQNDSIGGIIECRVTGLSPGLGEPFFDSVESLMAHALFSIPAIKGVEFGSGFSSAKMTGSVHNDTFINENGETLTNNAGGINGGLTNGNELVVRVAVKPTSSTPKTQHTFNKESGKTEDFTVTGRHDLCIAIRAVVVVESVVACVLTDLQLRMNCTNLH